MTRATFLLTLPILSFLGRDKVIDFKYEYKLLASLFEKIPTKPSITRSGELELVCCVGPELDRYFHQEWRVFWLKSYYGADNIKKGLVIVTEKQFIKDGFKPLILD